MSRRAPNCILPGRWTTKWSKAPNVVYCPHGRLKEFPCMACSSEKERRMFSLLSDEQAGEL